MTGEKLPEFVEVEFLDVKWIVLFAFMVILGLVRRRYDEHAFRLEQARDFAEQLFLVFDVFNSFKAHNNVERVIFLDWNRGDGTCDELNVLT